MKLDALLGGGIDNGSSTLLFGPAGTGKSLSDLDTASCCRRHDEEAACIRF